MRPQNRANEAIRQFSFEPNWVRSATGSTLVRTGATTVLCTCSIEPKVPPFLEGTGKGWLTAEYSMLPASTSSRKARDRGGKIDGRTVEIQRLIGRSLRAVVNLDMLGERTLWIDCDVLEADGGTRTASINGAFVALVLALMKKPEIGAIDRIIQDSVAAVSVGLLEGEQKLDLEYVEDKDAEVDMNLVMTGNGKFIEIQGAGEEATFTRDQFNKLIDLGQEGIRTITAHQKSILGTGWFPAWDHWVG